MTTSPAIEVRGATLGYGARAVLTGAELVVGGGERLALVGPNGAGKTTVVKLVTRLFEPTAGRILMNGIDAARFSPRSVQREMSIIFQDYGQYQMTARENIGLSRTDALDNDPAIEVAGEKSGAVEVVKDLPEGYETMLGRLFPGGRQLSGGQWQRVALGRALINEPGVLLLDEPLGALDLKLRRQMQIELKRIQTEVGITFVHVTHDQEEAMTMADTIAVMNHGLIEQIGAPDDLYENPETTFVANFLGQSNLIEAEVLDLVVAVDGIPVTGVDDPLEEPSRALLLRIVEELLRRSLLEDPAVVHDRDPVAQPLGVLHDVGGEDHRGARAGPHPQVPSAAWP